jgi:1-deoxy-D-xylulose-5-phosphate synthase
VNSPADIKGLSIEQLEQLAEEIRQAITKTIARKGGHFASNLCVVEQTLALHYVFDFAHDRLLFDVGHQCYPHKMLTGRKHLLDKVKEKDGMAGFPEPGESDYDLFNVGHAGTSISTAVGMAKGDSLLGQEQRRVVALIGDASIVNGLALEGLNSAGTLKRQMLVVLNDNGMAIAPPQGAMAHSFDRFRANHRYTGFKKQAHKVLESMPGGSALEEVYHRLGEITKAALSHNHMFEHFGLLCLGPIDGHDLRTLIEMLTEIKDLDRPVLLHCKTTKGKGFEPAEGDPFKFHAPKPDHFIVHDCKVEKKTSGKSFTRAYSDAMKEMMAGDDKIFTITAAMPDGTGLDKLAEEYPERVMDCGLCESNGMDIAAGMAKTGIKPFYAVYSTFSQRALDQTFQEVALQHLPVRICMDRAGYVGGDGSAMHGFMDITMNRVFPDVAILGASDEPNLKAALEFMRTYETSASFIRYPRDKVPAVPLLAQVPPYELGKALLMRPAKGKTPDLTILAYGSQVYLASDAINDLDVQGYDIALYDARFAKPIDIDLLEELVAAGQTILTIEDHSREGGFGSAVLETCNDHSVPTDNIYRMGMPEQWIGQDTRDGQLATAGLNAAGIARVVRQILDEPKSKPQIHIRPGAASRTRQ